MAKSLQVPKDAAELRSRIETLTAEDARLWGSMQVGQMVCHVGDAFSVALGKQSVGAMKPPPLPRAVIKWLALRVPRKWPKGVPTVPELDQGAGAGTRPTDFPADRARLLEKLDQFVIARGPWPAHAIFGAMTARDWMRWGYLHTDHHLRQFGR